MKDCYSPGVSCKHRQIVEFRRIVPPSCQVAIIIGIGTSTVDWPPARRVHAYDSLRLGENHSVFYGHFLVEPYGPRKKKSFTG